MADLNTFAVLIPVDDAGRARKAFSSQHNAELFHPAVDRAATPVPEQWSREATPSPSPDATDTLSFEATDRIILSLDHPPKDPSVGWLFGVDHRVVDVHLGSKSAGISDKHCRIWIDALGRVWLRDHSRNGTSVRYGDRPFEERVGNTWILQYYPGRHPQPWRHVTVLIRRLAFRIYFPNHVSPNEEYAQKLRSLHTESIEAIPILDGLGIQTRASTAAASTVASPTRREKPVFFELDVISQNAQAKVTRVINTRDGKVYVAKVFLSGYQGHKRKREGTQEWIEQVSEQMEIMRANPHPNIVPVVEFWSAPTPTMVMPYYGEGSLQDYIDYKCPKPVDNDKIRNILRQLLAGVAAIHDTGAVHRDLKPANILIISMNDEVKVVITDFGLSRLIADGPMETYCGTLPYLAPEVGTSTTGYGPPVDIWAIGVITLQLARPPFVEEYGDYELRQEWHEAIAAELKTMSGNVDYFREHEVLTDMLQEDVEARSSALQALDKGCDNGLFRRLKDNTFVDGDATIVNSPVASKNNTPVSRPEEFKSRALVAPPISKDPPQNDALVMESSAGHADDFKIKKAKM